MKSKVLITGSTSSQCSTEAHSRSARFSGLLNSAFNFTGTSSVMKSMPMDSTGSDIKDYETVIVGLAPFSSLSAHKIFTALNTLSIAFEQDKAKVLLDAPEPHLVFQSFKSILNNPSILAKDLYSKRDGYSDVLSDSSKQKQIISTIEKIVEGQYDIIVPTLPYYESNREDYGMPYSRDFSLYGFNFDKIFENNFHVIFKDKSKYWLAETPNSKWSTNISKTVAKPVISVRRNAYDTEGDYIKRMQDSYGYLLSTYKNGTPWWSANIMLALSCGIPVFSDWRHTGHLGLHWSGLPHTVEDFTYEERYALSVSQKESYLANLPSWSEASELVIEKLLP